jgi:hypothetical protein
MSFLGPVLNSPNSNRVSCYAIEPSHRFLLPERLVPLGNITPNLRAGITRLLKKGVEMDEPSPKLSDLLDYETLAKGARINGLDVLAHIFGSELRYAETLNIVKSRNVASLVFAKLRIACSNFTFLHCIK